MDRNSKEFKELQAKWYKKLEKSGFKDAETVEGYHEPYRPLRQWHASCFFLRHAPLRREAKTEYYRLAGQFLYDNTFKSKLEMRMWELHAEGKSIREIVRIMNKPKKRTYKRKVHETLQQLSKDMLAMYRKKDG